jgi:hypothetical protein
MGVLSRLLVPRSVRRAAHPVRTARRAVTPKPIKKIKRSVYVATNPLGALEGAAENAVVGALRSKPHRGKKNPGLRPAHRGVHSLQDMRHERQLIRNATAARIMV